MMRVVGTERPAIIEMVGQVVTLHFPNGDYTTGPLDLAQFTHEPTVNGWLVNSPGRFFSLDGKVYD